MQLNQSARERVSIIVSMGLKQSNQLIKAVKYLIKKMQILLSPLWSFIQPGY
jgi:hypothetical protein